VIAVTAKSSRRQISLAHVACPEKFIYHAVLAAIPRHVDRGVSINTCLGKDSATPTVITGTYFLGPELGIRACKATYLQYPVVLAFAEARPGWESIPFRNDHAANHAMLLRTAVVGPLA
jgi:hypothetical protein